MLGAGGFRFGAPGPTGVTRVAVLSGGGREGARDPEPARPAWLGALSLGDRGRGPAAGWGPAWPAGGCAARSGPVHSAQRGDRRRPRSPSAEKARRRSVYPHMGVSVHACMGGQSHKRPAPPADAGDHLQGAAGGGDAAPARWPAATLWPGAALRLVSALPPAAPGARNKRLQKEPGI